MSVSSDKWRSNFRLVLECTRCGAEFTVDRPVVGTEKVPGTHQRLVTVYAPESCPECHSLHAVDEPDNGPHLVVKERCTHCGYTCVGVIPVEAPQDALECGGCGRMTCVVTHYERNGTMKPRTRPGLALVPSRDREARGESPEDG
jgi:hypothetical protein